MHIPFRSCFAFIFLPISICTAQGFGNQNGMDSSLSNSTNSSGMSNQSNTQGMTSQSNSMGMSNRPKLPANMSATDAAAMLQELKGGNQQGSQIVNTIPDTTVHPFDEAKAMPEPPKKELEGSFPRTVKGLGYNVDVFGSDFLRSGANTNMNNQLVSPDYRLGTGDELDIRIWGAFQQQFHVGVDREGLVNLGPIGMISVGGMRFGDLPDLLKKEVGRYYRNFQLQVSMGRLRSLQVYMTGSVINPGVYSIKGPAMLSQLLSASGNLSQNGSLRNIQLRRHDSLVGSFDLYNLLIQGNINTDLPLADGDVIYVPPVGQQVALVKGVNRPGIYELKGGENLYQLCMMAGGFDHAVSSAPFRSERFMGEQGFAVDMQPLADSGKSYTLHPSEIISLDVTQAKFENAVVLRGNVASPGRFPFKPGMRIHDLIPDQKALLTDDFWNYRNGAPTRTDLTVVQTENLTAVNWEYAVIERFDPKTLTVSLIPFELGKVVLDNDKEQNYELMPGDVVTIFSSQDIPVPVERRSVYVTISGEVNRVGTYKMNHGETLQDVIKKAGGLTTDAYVFGAIFKRKSVEQLQKKNYDKLIQELEQQLDGQSTSAATTASTPEEAKLLADQLDAQRAWLAKLRNLQPEGRLILELPSEMNLREDALPNFPLEDGDQLIIPTQPSIVSVFGEVPMQNAFLFRTGSDVGDYLKKAGGATKYADKSGTFVLRADGSVVCEREYGFLFWHLTGKDAMPGDAIFVPKDMEYSRIMPLVKDWTQIIANLGLGAAAIVTLIIATK